MRPQIDLPLYPVKLLHIVEISIRKIVITLQFTASIYKHS
jgi:hypothetical protein